MTIIRRSNMGYIKQIKMDPEFRSNDLFLISQNNGKQTFIFYTLGKSLGMVEVLINGELEHD
jgi:hypothetical protein